MVKFRKEKAERNENGEVVYEYMEHFFKGPEDIITPEKPKREIRRLYRQDMADIQEKIDEWG